MKFIVVIIAAAIWFAYTNWGTPVKTDKAVKSGTLLSKVARSNPAFRWLEAV